MRSYKITVIEITTPTEGEPPRAVAPVETKVFEQTIEDLNLREFVRQLNVTPRVRRSRAKAERTASA